jgi:quercetin dioxygenase-like cupin family protein
MRVTRSRGRLDRAREIARLEARGLTVLEWRDAPGAAYAEHSHPDREIRVILAGSMQIACEGRTVVLRPGDRVELDPGAEHSARVGRTGVRYLAASEPPRP